jgi:hypothetical protein
VTAIAELVYGRRAVREALRGRREVLELLATERAARDGWERKPKVVPERTLTELAGTRDHQGVVARVEPFRYGDAYELAAGEPLLVALDQVTDPRNLGAVIRSAEGAGATGVILPAHNSARVTPVVARSSAGAVEHLPVAVVPNLARYLNEVKGPRLWVPHGRCGLVRGTVPGVRRGREGDPPARPARLRRQRLDSAFRPGRVAERLGRRRGAALRGEEAALQCRRLDGGTMKRRRRHGRRRSNFA